MLVAPQSTILSFFARFIIALIVLQFLVMFLHFSPAISTLIQGALTEVVAFVHEILGTQFIVKDNMLIHQHSLRFVVIDNECTGLMLLASVCAALIALNYQFKSTLKMLFIAIVVLQLGNIIRIAHLFFIIKQPDNSFEFYHLYFWQVINFISGLLVFYVLEKTFNKKSECYV